MVFLHLSQYGDSNGLPSESYGFDFADGKEEPEDEYSLKQEWLPDVTVRIPKKGGNSASSSQFTHRFMVGEYETSGVQILGGQTYEGVGCSGKIVGKICGAVFNREEMDESLQMAGDSLTQEVYEAMCELFTADGKPKGPFKKKCQGKDYYSILYISGVYVKKDQRGQGLGQEIVRALMQSLYANTESSIDLVLLCPAGEPNPGPGMWNFAFDSIASMFESRLKFERCGAKNRRTGQSLYMFLDADEHAEVFDAPVTPAVSESAAVTSAVRSAPKNDPEVSAEVATIVKSESSSSAPPVMAPAAASTVVKSDRSSDPELAPANVVSSDTASKRQKTS
jgi:ribosomal protein S18 acetylase RimI-like enzyme